MRKKEDKEKEASLLYAKSGEATIAIINTNNTISRVTATDSFVIPLTPEDEQNNNTTQ